MKRYIKAWNIDHEGEHTFGYEEVCMCPICHVAVQPKIVKAVYVPQSPDWPTEADLNIEYFCPNCRKVFLAVYDTILANETFNEGFCEHYTVYPYIPENKKFDEEIQRLSPDFVKIYIQAEVAEAHDLTEICGLGYRKALEYLVKDFLCHKTPENCNQIKAEMLGANVQRIDNERIKTLARCASWIGNDEAHYVRKHDDLNIRDMKRFIAAMAAFIASELAFERAEDITSK